MKTFIRPAYMVLMIIVLSFIFIAQAFSQNTPPSFTSIPLDSITDNAVYSLAIEVSDLENDTITITAPILPAWLTFSLSDSVSTIAGTSSAGHIDGPGSSARFDNPSGVAVDRQGNIYVADYDNHCIRKIDPNGNVSTIAGTGSPGHTDGPGTSARFNYPSGVAVDLQGNVYVADYINHRIRKIDPYGNVTTIAGTGSQGNTDGPGTSARFNYPSGVAVDLQGNVYVADYINHRIRKIDPYGNVTTIAGTGSQGNTDGPGTSARFNYPSGVAVDLQGNIYVADNSNHLIRKIDPNGNVSTIAGNGSYGHTDGPGTSARFYYPRGVAVDRQGNVYVADRSNHRIRKIDTNGIVSTIAGTGSQGHTDGPAEAARFRYPYGVAIDSEGNVLVADYNSHRIRKFNPNKVYGNTTGQTLGNHPVTLVASDGDGGSDTLAFNITITDAIPEAIITGGSLNTTNTAFQATIAFSEPVTGFEQSDIQVSGGTVSSMTSAGDTLFTATINPDTPGTVSVSVPGGVATDNGGNENTMAVPYHITYDPDPPIATLIARQYPGTESHKLDSVVFRVTFDEQVDNVDVADFMASGTVNTSAATIVNVNEVTASLASSTFDVSVTGFTGTGTLGVGFDAGQDIEDIAGNAFTGTIDSTEAYTIRENEPPLFSNAPLDTIDDQSTYFFAFETTDPDELDTITVTAPTLPAWLTLSFSDSVSTIAGTGSNGHTDGPGTSARFSYPSGVAIDRQGNIYVADENNHLIRKIDTNGNVSTIAGTGSQGHTDGPGTSARFSYPSGVAVDRQGNVYVADRNNHRIRKIDTNGNVSTIAGTGSQGHTDGPGISARFNYPSGVAVDQQGNVYVADEDNHRVRKIDTNGNVSTIAGTGSRGHMDGPGSSARFDDPTGVAVDQQGNVYVADRDNHRIRKIDTSGNVSTIAGDGSNGHTDGPGNLARFNYPRGVAVDQQGNVYVADENNHRIRKIDTNGNVSTIAGNGTQGYANGPAGSAIYNDPYGVAIDSEGNVLVADRDNHRIRKFNPNKVYGNTAGQTLGNHPVTLVATDGNGGSDTLAFNITITDAIPEAIITGGSLNTTNTAFQATIAFSEPVTGFEQSDIQVSGGTVSSMTSAGDTLFTATINPDTPGTVTVSIPEGVATDNGGNGNTAAIPYHITYDPDPPVVALVARQYPDTELHKLDSVVFRVTFDETVANVDTADFMASGTVNTSAAIISINEVITSTIFDVSVTGFTGTGTLGIGFDAGQNIEDIAGNAFTGTIDSTEAYTIRENEPPLFSNAPLDTIDDQSTYFFAFETTDPDELDTIAVTAPTLPGWLILSFNDSVSTIAGTSSAGHIDGPGSSARFDNPSGVAVDQQGNVYVADEDNHRIRKIDTNGNVSTIAGTGSQGHTDGPAGSARFDNPSGVTIDKQGNIYVADRNNHRIRKIDPYGNVTTLAGNGLNGHSDGPGNTARFNYPSGVAVDLQGNIYVADEDNHRIRKIDPYGNVTTLAGNGLNGHSDGPGNTARFNYPSGVAIDLQGNIYVADEDNHRIRKIDPNGNVSTIAGNGSAGYADGSGNLAMFHNPRGIAVDQQGNVYVADYINHRIRKIDPYGNVTTLAGDGSSGHADDPASEARFRNPRGVAIDSEGNVLVADFNNHRIRKFNPNKVYGNTVGQTPGNHPVTLVASDGNGGSDTLDFNITITDAIPEAIITGDSLNTTNAPFQATIAFSEPVTGFEQSDIQVSGGTVSSMTASGDTLFTATINPDTPGTVTVSIPEGVATDNGGNGNTAAIPYHITYDPDPPVVALVARQYPDTELHKLDSVVFRVTFDETVANVDTADFMASGTVNTSAAIISINEVITSTIFDVSVTGFTGTGTLGIGFDAGQNIEDIAGNAFTGTIDSTEAYTIRENEPPLFSNAPLDTIDDQSTYFFAFETTDPDELDTITVTAPILPAWLTLSFSDSVSTIAGTGSNGHTDGPGTSARFSYPSGVAIDRQGNTYVADRNNHRIRKIDTNGNVTTIAGTGSQGHTDGPGTSARFNYPRGVAVDRQGNVYIADRYNHRIRKIDPYGNVSTIAGTGSQGHTDGPGTSARFNYPSGVAVDQQGNVYVADGDNHRVRKIDTNGNVSTIAGTGSAGHTDGPGISARFYYPTGVAVDRQGNVYIADRYNHRIRKIDTNGNVSTIAGNGSAGYTDGPAGSARFNYPRGLAVDQQGNVYVADGDNHRIRKIDTNGIVSTIAGNGVYGHTDGPAEAARFRSPYGVVIDSEGNVLVADYNSHRIRKFNPNKVYGNTTGQTLGNHPVTLVATDGNGGSDTLAFNITITDAIPEAIITGGSNTTNTAFQATIAFSEPVTGFEQSDIQVSGGTVSSMTASGDTLFTATINPDTPGTVSVSVPGGVATDNGGNENTMAVPYHITYDPDPPVVALVARQYPGTELHKLDSVVFRVTFDETVANVDTADFMASGTVNTSAAIININEVTASLASSTFDVSVTGFTGTGTLGVGFDAGQNIEDIAGNAFTGTIDSTEAYTIRENEPPLFSNAPLDTIDDQSTYFFAFETTDPDELDTITVTAPILPAWLTLSFSDSVSTIAGTGSNGHTDGPGTSARFSYPSGVAIDRQGNTYVADRNNHRIRKIDTNGNVSTIAGTGSPGHTDGPGTSARFNYPSGVAVDRQGNVYIADRYNHRIRKIDPYGNVSTIAGTGSQGHTDGPGISARFNYPSGVAVDQQGNVYVADEDNHRVRKIDTNGNVSTIAGTGSRGHMDGPGSSARFDDPTGVAVGRQGNVYVADYGNHSIRKIDTNGNVTTIAGTGSRGHADGPAGSARFNYPRGLAVDQQGNVYVADRINNRIRKIDPTGNVSTIAGDGVYGHTDGPGTSARFRYPYGVAIDSEGNVLVADYNSHRIRKFNPNKIYGSTTGQTLGNHPVTLVATDGNGGSDTLSFEITLVNAIPNVESLSPSNGDSAISPSTSLQIIFSEPVNIGTDSIRIKRFDDDSTIESIALNSGSVTGNGTDTIRINPSNLPEDGSEVYIEVPSTAFNDGVDPFPGITDKHIWSFTMQDLTPPPAPVITDVSDDTGLSNEDAITKDTTLFINGTAESLAMIEVFINGIMIGSTVADSLGNWEYDHTNNALSDSTYAITAIATDHADNVSDTSSVFSLTIDTELPTNISVPSIMVTGNSPVTYTITYTGADTIMLSSEDIILHSTGSAGGDIEVTGTGNDTRIIHINNIVGDGSLSISIGDSTASDVAGNLAMAFGPSTSFTVDNMAPPSPIITGISDDTGWSNGDGITNDTTIIIEGTAEVESEVVLLINGTVIDTVVTDGSGDWSYDNTDNIPAEGLSDITAIAIDAAGNRSDTSDVFHLTIDISAPERPVITSVSDDTGLSAEDGITNDNTLIIYGTAETGAFVAVLLDGTALDTVATNGNEWSLDHTATMLADGNYQFTAVAIDTAGNNSMISDTLSVIIDTDAPTATATVTGISDDTGDDNSDNITRDNRLLISGTASEPGVHVEVYANGTGIGFALADGSGNWQFDHTGTPLADNTYSLTAAVTDTAGNTGIPGTAYMLTIDTDAPGITISDPSETHTQNGPVTFTVTYTEADSVMMDITDISLETTGNADGDMAVSGSGNSRIVTISNITGDGSLGISIADSTASDLAGNFATAAGPSDTFIVDNTAPTVTINSEVSNPTGDSSFVVSFTFSEAVEGFTVADITVTNGTADQLTQVNDTLYTAAVTPSASGEVNVQVGANQFTDLAENDNEASNTLTITYDNSPPSGYSASIDQDFINIENQQNIGFSFTGAELDATFQYTFNSGGGGTEVTGNGAITAANQPITGIDLSGLEDGTITLSVTLTDPLGNEGTAVNDTKTKDTDAPEVTAITALDTNPIPEGTTSIRYAVTFSEPVAGIGTDGFGLGLDGLTATIAAVSASSGDSVAVTVEGITGTGTLQLTMTGSGITDDVGNPLTVNVQAPVYRTEDVANTVPGVFLSDSSVVENSAIGTIVGTLSTDDPDAGDTHTYSLVAGNGDTDNSAFTISGNQLLTNGAFDFESKSSYSIRIQVSDGTGSTARVFNIAVTDVNEAPVALTLDNATVDENGTVGTMVGTFSTEDQDTGDIHTYSLVTGSGDTDNGAFTIVGDTLSTNAVFNFEQKSSYSIRVSSSDGEFSVEGEFTITINDVNDGPEALALSNASVAENQLPGALVGRFATTDEDDNAHTYSLVTGAGDGDNGFFVVAGDSLLTNAIFDYEQDSVYSILVQTQDAGGATFTQPFSISITDVDDTGNNAPTEIVLSNTSVAENLPVGTPVGTLSAVDADAGDTHLFTLVPGAGSTDNGSFSINGNQLLTSATFDFETQSSYSIRMQVFDGAAVLEGVAVITITNVGEPAVEVSVGSLAFPLTAVNDSSTLTFEIENTGDTVLMVSSITYPTGFSGDFANGAIALNSSQMVTVVFHPTQAQTYSGSIGIVSDGGNATIDITGDVEVVTAAEPIAASINIDLYPNPADKQVMIEMKNADADLVKYIEVYDPAGNKKQVDIMIQNHIITIGVGNLPEGVYPVVIELKDGTNIRKKLLVNR